jgi:hypothetical protein
LNELVAKLTSERKILFDGEKYERSTGKDREEAWGTERVRPISTAYNRNRLTLVKLSLTKQIHELRQSLQSKGDTLESLSIDHGKLKKSNALLKDTSEQDRTGYEWRVRELTNEVEKLRGMDRLGGRTRMKELEEEVDRLTGFERRAQALAIQLEEQKRMGGVVEVGVSADGGGQEMRKELRSG